MFTPDILVLEAAGPSVALAAAAMPAVRDWEQVGRDVRAYMVNRGGYLVLVTTPTETYLYRDPLTTADGGHIEAIGPWPSQILFGNASAESPVQLARRVHVWLERMARAPLPILPAELDSQTQLLIRFYVLPAVTEGRVVYGRAA